jgi:hypothetical protein
MNLKKKLERYLRVHFLGTGPSSLSGRGLTKVEKHWFKMLVCGRSPAELVGSNPTGGMDVLPVVSVVFCQVEVSAPSCSLVQRSPTDCGASLCVWSRKPQEWGGHDPRWVAAPQQKSILIVYLCMSTLTEVFPCFFLSCKANARVKPAKMGHGPHSS